MKQKANGEWSGIRRELKVQAALLFGLIGVFWILELVDFLAFDGGLDAFGIRPRNVDGLWGIGAAPFLHGGFAHLAANSLPFLVLGWLVMLRKTWHFFAVFLVTMALGGLGVWLVGGTATVHVGASGVIFGFLGFLLLSGWFDRKASTILISLAVLGAYGGMVFGVFPGQIGISWESHLFGFLAGILAARLLAQRKPKKATAQGLPGKSALELP